MASAIEGIDSPILEGFDLCTPQVRNQDALKGLTLYPVPDGEGIPIYFMFRDSRKKGASGWKDIGIRYDITVIPPKVLQGEFVKTIGHFHPEKNKGETYSEYYEVLQGKALFLFQKNTPDQDVEEVVFVYAETGDKVFVPANYGHITINPGNETLIICNLVENRFHSDYTPIQEKHGAAYYCIKEGDGETFIPNPNYKNIVIPQIYRAKAWPGPIFNTAGKDLYDMFLENPVRFEFLK